MPKQALSVHLLMLHVFCSPISSLTWSGAYQSVEKTPTLPAGAEVASEFVAGGVGKIWCATACTARLWCIGFYLQTSGAAGNSTSMVGSCRLLRPDVFANTWLRNATLRPWTLLTRVPDETKLNLTNCLQSSDLWEGVCQRNFDGNANQNFLAGYCSHTMESTNQWWQTDLGSGHFVNQIQIFNRQDCCASRLNSLTIRLDGVVCVTFTTGVAFSIRNFTCSRYGSVVRVQTPLSTGLVMCEVYIFGAKFP